MDIAELELSVSLYCCLKRVGINTVEDLTNRTPEDIMNIRNLGRRKTEELLKVMKDNDITFKY